MNAGIIEYRNEQIEQRNRWNAAAPQERKRLLGVNLLYQITPFTEKYGEVRPEHAKGRLARDITRLLLEMKDEKLLRLMNQNDKLKAKVDVAISILEKNPNPQSMHALAVEAGWATGDKSAAAAAAAMLHPDLASSESGGLETEALVSLANRTNEEFSGISAASLSAADDHIPGISWTASLGPATGGPIDFDDPRLSSKCPFSHEEFELGKLACVRGELDVAVAHFLRSVEHDKTNVPTYYALACLHQGRTEEHEYMKLATQYLEDYEAWQHPATVKAPAPAPAPVAVAAKLAATPPARDVQLAKAASILDSALGASSRFVGGKDHLGGLSHLSQIISQAKPKAKARMTGRQAMAMATVQADHGSAEAHPNNSFLQALANQARVRSSGGVANEKAPVASADEPRSVDEQQPRADAVTSTLTSEPHGQHAQQSQADAPVATNPHVEMFAGSPSATNPHMAFARRPVTAAVPPPQAAELNHVWLSWWVAYGTHLATYFQDRSITHVTEGFNKLCAKAADEGFARTLYAERCRHLEGHGLPASEFKFKGASTAWNPKALAVARLASNDGIAAATQVFSQMTDVAMEALILEEEGEKVLGSPPQGKKRNKQKKKKKKKGGADAEGASSSSGAVNDHGALEADGSDETDDDPPVTVPVVSLSDVRLSDLRLQEDDDLPPEAEPALASATPGQASSHEPEPALGSTAPEPEATLASTALGSTAPEPEATLASTTPEPEPALASTTPEPEPALASTTPEPAGDQVMASTVTPPSTAAVTSPSVTSLTRPPAAFQDDDGCVVCMNEAATHAFAPCGHQCVCKWCADQITKRGAGGDGKCPVCRVDCFMAMAIYKS